MKKNSEVQITELTMRFIMLCHQFMRWMGMPIRNIKMQLQILIRIILRPRSFQENWQKDSRSRGDKTR